MTTPCYYCELSLAACKVCIHGEADAEELAKDALDAKRYRWLRNDANKHKETAPLCWWTDHCGNTSDYSVDGSELDEAIDAAISQSKQGGETA